MKTLQSKLVHMGAVAALAGYCYWCEQAETSVRVAVGEKHNDSLKKLLSPTIEPAPQRNPFEAAGRPQTAQRSPAQLAGAEADTPSDPSAAFLLGATIIHGQRRLALINGRLYGEGDSLTNGVSEDQPYTVASIYTDKVLLDRGGQSLWLGYSAASPRAKAGREKAVASRGAKSEGSAP